MSGLPRQAFRVPGGWAHRAVTPASRTRSAGDRAGPVPAHRAPRPRGEQLKPRPRDGRGVGATVAGVGDLVAVTPENEGGNGDAGQAGRQAGVAHGGAAVDGEGGAVARHDGLLLGGHRGRIDTERIRVVIAQFGDLVQRETEEVDDGVIRDIDTHRVDQHDAADSGGAEQDHLGRDPAADGFGHDHEARLGRHAARTPVRAHRLRTCPTCRPARQDQPRGAGATQTRPRPGHERGSSFHSHRSVRVVPRRCGRQCGGIRANDYRGSDSGHWLPVPLTITPQPDSVIIVTVAAGTDAAAAVGVVSAARSSSLPGPGDSYRLITRPPTGEPRGSPRISVIMREPDFTDTEESEYA